MYYYFILLINDKFGILTNQIVFDEKKLNKNKHTGLVLIVLLNGNVD